MWTVIKDFYTNANKALLILMEVIYLIIGVWNVMYLTMNDISFLVSLLITVGIELIIHAVILFCYTQI